MVAQSSAVLTANGSNGPHVDARRLIIPLWLALTLAVSFSVTCGSLIAMFLGLSNKIDQMVAKVEGSVAKSDFESFCLRAQIVNTNWTCPGYSRQAEVEEPKLPKGPRPKARQKPGCSPFNTILGQC